VITSDEARRIAEREMDERRASHPLPCGPTYLAVDTPSGMWVFWSDCAECLAKKLKPWDLAVTVDKADSHVWTDAEWMSSAGSEERPL